MIPNSPEDHSSELATLHTSSSPSKHDYSPLNLLGFQEGNTRTYFQTTVWDSRHFCPVVHPSLPSLTHLPHIFCPRGPHLHPPLPLPICPRNQSLPINDCHSPITQLTPDPSDTPSITLHPGSLYQCPASPGACPGPTDRRSPGNWWKTGGGTRKRQMGRQRVLMIYWWVPAVHIWPGENTHGLSHPVILQVKGPGKNIICSFVAYCHHLVTRQG